MNPSAAKLAFASLAGVKPDDLVNFRLTSDGSAVAIIPTGQKYKYTAEQLAQREALLYAASAQPASRKGGFVPAKDETPAQTNTSSSSNPVITKTHPTRKGGSVPAKDETPKEVNASSSLDPVIARTRPSHPQTRPSSRGHK